MVLWGGLIVLGKSPNVQLCQGDGSWKAKLKVFQPQTQMDFMDSVVLKAADNSGNRSNLISVRTRWMQTLWEVESEINESTPRWSWFLENLLIEM